jgi:hypothetical protein
MKFVLHQEAAPTKERSAVSPPPKPQTQSRASTGVGKPRVALPGTKYDMAEVWQKVMELDAFDGGL